MHRMLVAEPNAVRGSATGILPGKGLIGFSADAAAGQQDFKALPMRLAGLTQLGEGEQRLGGRPVAAGRDWRIVRSRRWRLPVGQLCLAS
ncbi:hypothetical protein [Parachitinimonas caeni]|uniref:Uncharacterized protein n=1 Tax=Parachitinimonas caeni TaxID=3031301 RepID=A0ABT7DZX8_9NEIS|nr:hypothetical protein [Parachitinimonas caeni]MDK2125591.1 hypothetical protein [Parachitinimonas caeni]